MRAVSLSDEKVQEKIVKSFIPLKVAIIPRTEKFPLDWPALGHWAKSYRLMGGEKCEGITGCSVVGPDLKVEYGCTGSAFVWEMFDSIAYDAEKFAAMLDRAAQRWDQEMSLRADKSLSFDERKRKLDLFHAKVRKDVGSEGRFRLPPRGFTIKGAIELFQMSGDLSKK